ncbi:MAG TPA: redoxin domain-containing protein [Planctomycetaceae bacterium]|nr:redoxin domain-containing protein [Planctomycetaceae bacterium]
MAAVLRGPYSSNVLNASKRILVLPVAAAIIAGLCAYRLTRPPDTRTFIPPPLMVALPPQLEFELFDQHKPPERVRLKSFLGRHAIVVVFFDGTAGANDDGVLLRLRRDAAVVKSRGVIALGVSTALPQENRPLADDDPRKPDDTRDRTPFLFPLLADVPPECRVHRAWGRYDTANDRPLSGVFLIDRAGRIAWDEDLDGPRPLEQPQQVLDGLLGTS